MILILFGLKSSVASFFCSQQADSFISGNPLCMMMRNIGSITIHWDSRGIVQNKSKPNPETSIRPTEYKSIGPADSLKLAYSSKWIYPARFPELNCLQMGWFLWKISGRYITSEGLLPLLMLLMLLVECIFAMEIMVWTLFFKATFRTYTISRFEVDSLKVPW